MIVITSRKDGFRRAGIAHPARPTGYPPARPTGYPDDFFSDERLRLLEAEPMLTVAKEPDVSDSSPEVGAGKTRKKP